MDELLWLQPQRSNATDFTMPFVYRSGTLISVMEVDKPRVYTCVLAFCLFSWLLLNEATHVIKAASNAQAELCYLCVPDGRCHTAEVTI